MILEYMAAHNDLGKWGENCAAEYLQRKGYTIVVRDWKSGHRDIDIVAKDNETLVFVEVKTRRNRVFIENYLFISNKTGQTLNSYYKSHIVNIIDTILS